MSHTYDLAVVGGGAMGRGIAETAAARGLKVAVIEISAEQRQRALAQMRGSLEKAIKKGRLKFSSADDVLPHIVWAESLSAAADAALVVEAVPETEALKIDLFQQLDALCPPDTILASNTSSISIDRLAAATRRPEKVAGMHFFNPVPIMPPVEIVRGAATDDATVTTVKDLAERMGKQAFVVRDRPGFVVNRVLMPLINEAVWALSENVADAATIDSLMKLGCNHPMGPLELADFVGLDICLSILQVLERDLKNPKFAPCPLLATLVAEGKLGRKSGEGFYKHER